MTTARLRVALADDATLIREGLARLLEDEGFEVVGQAGDRDELRALLSAEPVDVVIVDVRMPPSHTTEGLEAAMEIRAANPGQPVVVVSQHLETRYARELLGGGARAVGYLLKERVGAVSEFVAAVRRVALGGTAIDPEMVAVLMRRSARDGALDALTEREREVLALIAEGLSNSAISRRLHIGLRTVESHVGSIFGKLGLLPEEGEERRVLAAMRYLRGDC